MMDGYDLQRLEYTKRKAINLGFDLGSRGGSIWLDMKKGGGCAFQSVDEAFQWLCGYEWGYERGKVDAEVSHA